VTTRDSLLTPDRSSDHYRPARRRWVPKGVLLLILLFAVGLLAACQSAVLDTAQAEIVVPATPVITVGLHREDCSGNALFTEYV
jgi:hypothetical protein